MKRSYITCALLMICITYAVFGEETELSSQEITDGETKMSQQIKAILEHYKQPDPVGLPGAPIPDPMPIPDMKHSFSFSTMDFKNVQVWGLSKFRIVSMETDLTAMQLNVALHIDVLEIKGRYTLKSFFTRSNGNFTVTLSNVEITGLAKLEVQRSGQLQAQNIDMDIAFQNIAMNFQNLGLLGSVFQGIINSVGSFLFDSIKPFILSEVNTNIRGDVNKQIENLPQRFPNSISPLDMAIAQTRILVRENKYDPYKIPDYHYNMGMFTVDLSHIWVQGMSTFYRVGDAKVSMKNNIMYVGLHVGTQRLEGKCIWEVGVGGFVSRAGSTAFTVEYIHVEIVISQPLDTRNHPRLEDFNLKLGNLQMRVDGAGTIDYVLEFLVNILPNLLRYQIVDAVEGPLKRRIQDELDKIEVEEMIEDNISQLDNNFPPIKL